MRVARYTIKKYLLKFILAKKTLEQIDAMSYAQMSRLFFIKERIEVVDKRVRDLESLLPSLATMLKKRGVTNHYVKTIPAKVPSGLHPGGNL